MVWAISKWEKAMSTLRERERDGLEDDGLRQKSNEGVRR